MFEFPPGLLIFFSMDDNPEFKAMLEAVLFISGEPVMLSDLKDVTEVSEKELAVVLDELVSEYSERQCGMLIEKVAGGYQMFVNPAHNELIIKLKGKVRAQKLSVAALETLAIVAYKQPL